MRVVLLCPSLNNACGISTYTKYVAESLLRLGIDAVATATIDEAYRQATSDRNFLVIQHEYGLYDRFSITHESPTVAEIINLSHQLHRDNSFNRSCIVMHTFHPYDHVYSCINRQIISSGIPVYHLNRLGAALHGLRFLEHGVFDLNKNISSSSPTRNLNDFRIGSFGFLSPNKNVKAIIDAVVNTDIVLIANYATSNSHLADELRQYASSKGVCLNLTTDFLSESDILQRLSCVHACITMQDPISHYATSGSTRFLMNLGLPIICTSNARQFDDLGASVIRSSPKSLAHSISLLRESHEYYTHCRQNLLAFCNQYELGSVYKSLLSELNTGLPMHKITFASDDFRTPSRVLSLENSVDTYQPSTRTPDTLQEVYKSFTDEISSAVSRSLPPYRLSQNLTPEDFFASATSPFPLIRRYLSSRDTLVTCINSILKVRTVNGSMHGSILRLSDEIAAEYFERDEINDYLDSIYKVPDSEQWRSLGHNIFDFFTVEAVSHSTTNVPTEYALLTALLVKSHLTLPLLKLLLPGFAHALDDFSRFSGPPPERLSKRWQWLKKLHHHISTCDVPFIASGCQISHFLTRHLFCVEEFLWVDLTSFFRSCSLALLKEGSSDIKQLWTHEQDTVFLRISHILSCYSQGVLQKGHPLVLFFGWLIDDFAESWDQRLNRACRSARLLISDSPVLSLSSAQPRPRGNSRLLSKTDLQTQDLLRDFVRSSLDDSTSLSTVLLAKWLSDYTPSLSQSYISPYVARDFTNYRAAIIHEQ